MPINLRYVRRANQLDLRTVVLADCKIIITKFLAINHKRRRLVDLLVSKEMDGYHVDGGE